MMTQQITIQRHRITGHLYLLARLGPERYILAVDRGEAKHALVLAARLSPDEIRVGWIRLPA